MNLGSFEAKIHLFFVIASSRHSLPVRQAGAFDIGHFSLEESEIFKHAIEVFPFARKYLSKRNECPTPNVQCPMSKAKDWQLRFSRR
jgi:hypothetical protein